MTAVVVVTACDGRRIRPIAEPTPVMRPVQNRTVLSFDGRTADVAWWASAWYVEPRHLVIEMRNVNDHYRLLTTPAVECPVGRVVAALGAAKGVAFTVELEGTRYLDGDRDIVVTWRRGLCDDPLPLIGERTIVFDLDDDDKGNVVIRAIAVEEKTESQPQIHTDGTDSDAMAPRASRKDP